MLGRVALLTGLLVGILAVALAPDAARAAADQAWPPFVLVTGLLAIGDVVNRDGLFSWAGGKLGGLASSPRILLLGLLALVAAVTAVLNLDTAVTFLTPVLVLAARARGTDEEPFLYGALVMANASSLLLPGSNLTNLLVLAKDRVSGLVFAERMLPAWVAAVGVTAAAAVVIQGRHPRETAARSGPVGPHRPRFGLVACAVVGVLVLVVGAPAVPVLLAAGVVAAIGVGRRVTTAGQLWRAVGPESLVAVFALAVALGALARRWDAPGGLIGHAGSAETAIVGAVAAVVVNNLPAAVLLTARAVPHPRALLLGLDVGPNLAVTGSLSALLWFRAARSVEAHPSVMQVSRIGVVLVPVTLLVAGAALAVFARP